MLGFAPLASTALADDVGTQEFDLVADQASFSVVRQAVEFHFDGRLIARLQTRDHSIWMVSRSESSIRLQGTPVRSMLPGKPRSLMSDSLLDPLHSP